MAVNITLRQKSVQSQLVREEEWSIGSPWLQVTEVKQKHLVGRWEKRQNEDKSFIVGENITYAFDSDFLDCLLFNVSMFQKEAFFFLTEKNERDEGERACLSESHQKTIAPLKTHSILENMYYYETLLHFCTKDYQDVGGADGDKELSMKSPHNCPCTGILTTTWH